MGRYRRLVTLAVLGCLFIVCPFIAGCAAKGGGAVVRTPYFGPTEPMATVVAKINENNEKLPTLWASHGYEATVVDEQKKSHFVNGDGVLLYQSPGNLRLIGQKDLIGTVFEIGSNSQTYWAKIVPEIDTLWIGKWADYSEAAMARYQIPIRPDMVLAVLGVATLDTNFSDLPAPTMRFNNDADAYMFVWSAKLPDRWVAQREVWYDRKTYLPLYVFLFDENGRVVLRARLEDHRPVEVENVAKDKWPKVATQYGMFFPDTGSRINLTLKDVMLSKQSGRVTAPNSHSFTAPNPEKPGVSHVIQIR